MIIKIYPLLKSSNFWKLNIYHHYFNDLFQFALQEYKKIPEERLKNDRYPCEFMNKVLFHPLNDMFYFDTVVAMTRTLPLARRKVIVGEYDGVMELCQNSIHGVSYTGLDIETGEETQTEILTAYGRINLDGKIPMPGSKEKFSLRRISDDRWELILSNSETTCEEYDDKET